MLTDAHRVVPRTRLVLGQAASNQVLRPAGVALLKTRHCQQTRSYRFGMWSSYTDPQFSKDLERRYRMMKHNKVVNLRRKLSWERHPFAKDARDIIKRMLERHILAEDPSQSRSINPDSTSARNNGCKGTSDGPLERESKIFDEFDPFEDHQRGRKEFIDLFNEWKGGCRNGIRQGELGSISSKKQAKTRAQPEAAENAQVNKTRPDEDYVIDPITNRRVARDVAGSFKTYRSQFSSFYPPDPKLHREPIHSDGPPSTEELKKYEKVDIDPNPSGVSGSSQSTAEVASGDLKTYRTSDPAMQSEEYSLNHLPPEEPDETYDDLHKYKPYMYNESNSPVQGGAPKYDDLHKYRPYMYNEDAVAEDSTSKYDDLDKYGPYMYNEDAKPEQHPPRYNDLNNYQPFMYKEEQADWSSSKPGSTPQYDDLENYNPTEFEDPAPMTGDQPFSQYGDLEQYKMFRHQELDGRSASEKDPVAKSPRDYESKDTRPTISERLQKLDLSDSSACLGKLDPSAHGPTVLPSAGLEREMDEQRKASDEVDRKAHANIQESRAKSEDDTAGATKPQLTGNFIKDFPEEFSQSWAMPMTADRTAEARESSELEPALDRQAREREELVDLYSKEPQGLETSYAEECGGRPTWPTFVKTYGADLNPGEEAQDTQSPMPNTTADIPGLESESASHRDAEIDGLPREETPQSTTPTSTATRIPEPTLYKILAYDPMTQNITTAETTSRVTDDAKPLTPAEVLLRLSNPSKFLPHFTPLHNEGFEIISGAGDLLVFRKVRPLPPPTETPDETTTIKKTSPPVNPIDLMGRPLPINAAATFASPTGFVNYELPVEKEPTQDTATAATEEPFRSGIDVRREEPVFSGPKSESSRSYTGGEGGKKKGLGIGRRMLFAGVWVGGISYALGVMGEFFITGGVDGKGPTGF